MATFTMVADSGLYKAPPSLDNGIIAQLVAYAAANVPWNLLGTAPKNFGKQTVGTQVKSIHQESGVEFKSGFHMMEEEGAQKWEGHANAGGFRLDLQNIESGWANFSVQNNASNTYTLAKCMMKTNISFGQGQLIHALLQSAQQKKSCQLT